MMNVLAAFLLGAVISLAAFVLVYWMFTEIRQSFFEGRGK